MNHFIVSQVNAHSALLSTMALKVTIWSSPLYSILVGVQRFLKSQVGDYTRNVVNLATSHSNAPSWSSKRGFHQFLFQNYEGRDNDITITPWMNHISVLKAFQSIIKNPTDDEYLDVLWAGESATWPFIARIKAQCQVKRHLLYLFIYFTNSVHYLTLIHPFIARSHTLFTRITSHIPPPPTLLLSPLPPSLLYPLGGNDVRQMRSTSTSSHRHGGRGSPRTCLPKTPATTTTNRRYYHTRAQSEREKREIGSYAIVLYRTIYATVNCQFVWFECIRSITGFITGTHSNNPPSDDFFFYSFP